MHMISTLVTHKRVASPRNGKIRPNAHITITSQDLRL